jgi:hypothetical protein
MVYMMALRRGTNRFSQFAYATTTTTSPPSSTKSSKRIRHVNVEYDNDDDVGAPLPPTASAGEKINTPPRAPPPPSGMGWIKQEHDQHDWLSPQGGENSSAAASPAPPAGKRHKVRLHTTFRSAYCWCAYYMHIQRMSTPPDMCAPACGFGEMY